jgi:hypothetical protein
VKCHNEHDATNTVFSDTSIDDSGVVAAEVLLDKRLMLLMSTASRQKENS